MPLADLDELELVSARSYGEQGYPHAAWTRLRRESPVHYCQPPGYPPFWAVTRHADIVSISRQPERFLNGPRQLIHPAVRAGADLPFRTIVNMDPPEHRHYRRLASAWFTPRNLMQLEHRMQEISRAIVDTMAVGGADTDCDFVTEVAAWHPLRMIMEILGVPAADEAMLLRLTNELFGVDDPEFRRHEETDGVAVVRDLFAYFSELVRVRRAVPGDDLGSALANATLDGSLLPEREVLSYFLVVATAGHETTRNAISGGLLALVEHPDQLAALRDDPGLLDTAVDEIVRWTSPVVHFARTAAEDCEMSGGQTVRAGDALALFYPSANRDEDVFDDPFAFRVDRDPNPHVGFGIGEHYCLGAQLARMELKALFAELVPRLDAVELTGVPSLLRSSFVGGVKHLPIRCHVAPSAGARR